MARRRSDAAHHVGEAVALALALVASVKPVSPDRPVLPVQQAEVLQSKVVVRGVARFRWRMIVLQSPLQVILVLEWGLDAELGLHRQGKIPLAVLLQSVVSHNIFGHRVERFNY